MKAKLKAKSKAKAKTKANQFICKVMLLCAIARPRGRDDIEKLVSVTLWRKEQS